MEEMIARFLEQGVVSGGFILVLYYILQKQDRQLNVFAEQMEKSNILLAEISNTLTHFGTRLQRLEGKDKEGE